MRALNVPVRVPWLLLILFVLAGCTHTSVFTEDYYYRSAGRRGDIIVTVNMDRARGLYEQSADAGTQARLAPVVGRTDRLTAALRFSEDGSTVSSFSGGAEGNFSKSLVTSALRLSGDWTGVDGRKMATFTDSARSMEIAVAHSGLVLFSSEDITDVYEYSYAEREILIPFDTAQLMERGMFSLYVEKPEDLKLLPFEIPEKLVESIHSVYLLFDEDDGGDFALTGAVYTDRRAAGRVISTSLKMDYLQRVRELENPPEGWQDDIIWEELDVMFEKMFIERKQVVDLFGTLLQQL
jgi:hypothetical protein